MADEQIINVQPEEDLTHLRERLEQVQKRHIILVVQPPTQLKSLVSWRLLHSRVRELGKDVLVITSDSQIRATARAAGFKVDNTMTSPPSGRTRGPTSRPVQPVRRTGPSASSRSSSDGDATPAKSDAGAVTPPPIDGAPEEIAPQPGTPTPAPGQSSDNRFEIEDLGDLDNGIPPLQAARPESEEEDILLPVSRRPPPIRRVTRPLSPAGKGPTPSRASRPLPGTPARAVGTRRAAAGSSRSGNWAECSNENTGLRAIASNIQPNYFRLNVRRHFHALTHLHSTYHFSNKRCSTDFHSFLGIFRSGSGTSDGGSTLFEPSARFSNLEADSVEPSPHLPPGKSALHLVYSLWKL